MQVMYIGVTLLCTGFSSVVLVVLYQVGGLAMMPTVVSIDEMELCVVLSNLFENVNQGKKWQLCIRIRNSFGGRVRQDENGEYLSTKKQGGIGLKSVAAIVARHHGVLNITQTKKTFTVDVAL